MDKITYHHDWNKKLSNPLHSTIRSKYWKDKNGVRTDKTKYYLSHIGKPFRLVLVKNKKEFPICDVRLVSVDCMKLRDIQMPLLRVDTGLTNRTEIYALFKKFGIGLDDEALILVFARYE